MQEKNQFPGLIHSKYVALAVITAKAFKYEWREKYKARCVYLKQGKNIVFSMVEFILRHYYNEFGMNNR